MMIHPYHKKCPNSLPPSYLEMVGQWWTSSRVDVLKLSRSGCESPITRIFVNSPKNPDPSYGNTRPSVHDNPRGRKKTGGNLTPPSDIPYWFLGSLERHGFFTADRMLSFACQESLRPKPTHLRQLNPGFLGIKFCRDFPGNMSLEGFLLGGISLPSFNYKMGGTRCNFMQCGRVQGHPWIHKGDLFFWQICPSKSTNRCDFLCSERGNNPI